jgi:hypothetical protein
VLRQPLAVSRLAERVRMALRETGPSSRVEPRTAALVALAATGELPTVFPRAVRREHKRRIAELAELTGPTVPALRKAIQAAQAAASAGG